MNAARLRAGAGEYEAHQVRMPCKSYKGVSMTHRASCRDLGGAGRPSRASAPPRLRDSFGTQVR